jgi:hypothetical protein
MQASMEEESSMEDLGNDDGAPLEPDFDARARIKEIA